jgi:hypothetical protein
MNAECNMSGTFGLFVAWTLGLMYTGSALPDVMRLEHAAANLSIMSKLRICLHGVVFMQRGSFTITLLFCGLFINLFIDKVQCGMKILSRVSGVT